MKRLKSPYIVKKTKLEHSNHEIDIFFIFKNDGAHVLKIQLQ